MRNPQPTRLKHFHIVLIPEEIPLNRYEGVNGDKNVSILTVQYTREPEPEV